MQRVRPYTIEDAAQFVPYWSFGFVKEPREDSPPIAFGCNLPGAGDEAEAAEEAWGLMEVAYERDHPGETFMRSEWHYARPSRIVNGN